MSDSIKVAIKVRPLIKREQDDGLPIQWTVQGNSITPVDPELKKRGEGGFHFDHIFDMSQTNDEVFNTVAKPVIDAAINGVNGTIFAYGQTSSGKTYTMMGSNDNPGVIPQAVDYIFDTIANTYGREFLLRVSYIEIYNERINDLLDKDRIDLKIKEDTKTGQIVVLCKEEVINSPAKVLAIMRKGDGNRRTGETNMNERSSRSHTIFRLTIESRATNDNSDGAVNVSQLNLVDLAGSERARQTGATGERFNEGRHINMSLSALGLVIMQLSECQENPQKYVNFRDSKLTRILQASLGGNAITTIICAVTPATFDETQCTLAFASRAKRVKNKPQVNEVLSDAALLKRYAKQMAKLKAELEKAKSADVVKMESELLEKERANQILEERIELLKKSIVCGSNSTEQETFNRRAKRRRTWGGSGTMPSKIASFPKATGLPTIKELEKTPEKMTKKEHIKRRQSIIQSLDFANQTFQTEFADFELELIESERARDETNRLSDGSVCDEDYFITTRRPQRIVHFQDDISVISSSCRSVEATPERKSLEPSGGEPASPSTPKLVLRNRITFLMEEYNALRKDHRTLEEFTKLEKQMFVEDAVEAAMTAHNSILAASEQKCREITEKYTKLESHSSASDKRLADLEQQLAESASSLKALKRENQGLLDELSGFRTAKRRVGSHSSESEKETSSIFANATYFEEMDVSDAQLDGASISDTQDASSLANLTVTRLDESKKSKELSNAAYSEFVKQIGEKSRDELAAVMQELINAKLSLEDDNLNLQTMLQRKIREADDVKNDIRELKSGIEKLQETIQLLTVENTDLTSKLSAEREHAGQAEKNLQNIIAELNSSISAITEEKTLLESSVRNLEEQLKAPGKSAPSSDPQLAEVTAEYREVIASQTREIEELSSNLMSKIEELDRLKDAKALPGEHECAYRELSISLADRNKLLEAENIELSENLMEKIEEYDSLKEELDNLKFKFSSPIAPTESSKLIEIPDNSGVETAEFLRNDKWTNRTVDDLLRMSVGADDSVRRSAVKTRESGLDLLRASFAASRNSTNGSDREIVDSSGECSESSPRSPTVDDLLQISLVDAASPSDDDERTVDPWKIKAEMLQEQVNHLNLLNSKLSDLKITSCSQCAHLAELNENRKSLKLEAKALNRKLRELQEKFDRECADSALLRTKASEELNLSVCDLTLNGSAMLEGYLNVSFVEEKVQALHRELEVLREKHDKLSELYREKCTEVDKLQDTFSRETTPTPASSESPRFKRSDGKLERIQTDMEKLRSDLRHFKKSLAGISGALQKFLAEKSSMLEEIEALKSEKAANFASAEEKVARLENEVARLAEEIRSSNLLSRELERAKVSLETEVETLRAERAAAFSANVAAEESPSGQERIRSLENEVARLCREIYSSNAVKCQLEDAKASLQSELQALQAERAKFDCQAPGEENVTAEKLKFLETEVTRLGEEICRANAVKGELANVKSSLEAEVVSLRAEKASVDETSTKTEDISAGEKVKFLENEVARLSDEIRRLNADKETLTSAKSSLETEVERLRTEKTSVNQNFTQTEETLDERKVNLLEKEVARLSDEIGRLIAEKGNLTSVESSPEADDRVPKAEKMLVDESFTKPEVVSTGEEIKFSENEAARLGEEISRLIADKERLTSDKSSLEAQVESLKAERASTEDTLARTEDIASKEQIKSLENEVTRLNEEIKTLHLAKDEIEALKSSLEAEARISSEKMYEDKSTEAGDPAIEERMKFLESEVARYKTHSFKFVKQYLQTARPPLEPGEESSVAERSFFSEIKELDDCSMSQETMKYLENEVSRLSEEINNSNVVKEELVSTKSSLEAVVESLKAETVAFDEKITQTEGAPAQERISLLEKEVARLSDEIIHSSAVKEELESAKSSLEAEVKYLKAEKSSAEDESSAQERIAVLETELIRLSDEIDGSNVLNQRAESANSSLAAEIDRLKAEAKAREQSVGELLESLRNLESDNSALKLTLERVTFERDELVSKIAAMSQIGAPPNNNDEDLVKIVASLQLKLKETNEALQNYTRNNQELNVRLTAVGASEAELNATKSLLENQVAALQDERTNYEASLASLRKSLEELQDSNAALTIASESTISRLEDVEANLEERHRENSELADKLRALEGSEDELINAKVEIASLKAETTSLEESLGDARRTIAGLRESNFSLTSELEKTRAQTEKDSEAEIVESSYETLKEYERMVEELRTKVQDITNDLHANAKETRELNDRLTQLNSAKNELSDVRLTLESEVNGLKVQRDDLEASVAGLRRTILELEDRNSLLDLELQSMRREKRSISEVASDNHASPNLRDHENTTNAMRIRVEELTAELNKYAAENEELSARVVKLQETLKTSNSEEDKPANDEKLEISSIFTSENLADELESARNCITKEIKSLKPSLEVHELSDKSISELFALFVHTIMSKEQEIIKALSDRFEREKRALEEQNRQSCDAEKRATVWAKELEAEVERTQQDLARQEAKCLELSSEIARLQNLLKESAHENQLLNEKMQVLELDFNTLQAELEKHPEVKQNVTLNSTQEKERLIQETVETREMELSAKLRLVEKQSKEKLEELTKSFEFYRTKNLELASNIEGLEANEKQLKSIADIKSHELAKSNSTVERLRGELEHLTEIHDQLTQQHAKATRQIDEITAVLKTKCDKLSEYKTKLETITPEYEHLRGQAAERQLRLEKYKSEIECMTTENEKEISSLRDNLDCVEIKSAGYRKQVADLTNRNAVLQTDIAKLRSKCEDLERANAKLTKSMRNSTSKIRAEEEMEDLRDENRTLQRNLDGASNRIADLQEMKSQVLKELVDLRGKYEALCGENNEMKKALCSHKATVDQSIELRGKFESLLQEKNRIALELEAKKSMLLHLENKHKDCEKEIAALKVSNKELDEEMDDIVAKIEELRKENAELDDKLYTIESSGSSEGTAQLKAEIESLRLSVESLRLQRDQLRVDLQVASKSLESYKAENSELRTKLGHLDHGDSLSCDSSRSGSPALEAVRVDNRRRRSRTELFNQKRQLEIFEAGEQPCCGECRCAFLQDEVCKLERELVTKNGEIATMEIRIQSENFPHMKRCKDLDELLASARRKCKILEAQLQKLRESKAAELSSECEKCRHWKANKRDQSTQCLPNNEPIYLSGMSSGIVEDHLKIAKLQKDKETMKTLCRGRQKQIVELQSRIKQLEKELDTRSSNDDDRAIMLDASSSSSSSKRSFAVNPRQAMKENVPTIWESQRSAAHTKRDWFN